MLIFLLECSLLAAVTTQLKVNSFNYKINLGSLGGAK